MSAFPARDRPGSRLPHFPASPFSLALLSASLPFPRMPTITPAMATPNTMPFTATTAVGTPWPRRRSLLAAAGALLLAGCGRDTLGGLHGIPLDDARLGREMRDTPAVLRAYLDAFDASFVGLSGSLEDTQATARSFKAFYAKVPTGASYTMDHSALTYVFDAQGKLRVAVRHTQSAQAFADDLRRVIALNVTPTL